MLLTSLFFVVTIAVDALVEFCQSPFAKQNRLSSNETWSIDCGLFFVISCLRQGAYWFVRKGTTLEDRFYSEYAQNLGAPSFGPNSVRGYEDWARFAMSKKREGDKFERAATWMGVCSAIGAVIVAKIEANEMLPNKIPRLTDLQFWIPALEKTPEYAHSFRYYFSEKYLKKGDFCLIFSLISVRHQRTL